MIDNLVILTLIAIFYFVIRIGINDYRIEGFPVLFSLIAGFETIADGYVTYGLCVMFTLMVTFFVHILDVRIGGKR